MDFDIFSFLVTLVVTNVFVVVFALRKWALAKYAEDEETRWWLVGLVGVLVAYVLKDAFWFVLIVFGRFLNLNDPENALLRHVVVGIADALAIMAAVALWMWDRRMEDKGD